MVFYLTLIRFLFTKLVELFVFLLSFQMENRTRILDFEEEFRKILSDYKKIVQCLKQLLTFCCKHNKIRQTKGLMTHLPNGRLHSDSVAHIKH